MLEYLYSEREQAIGGFQSPDQLDNSTKLARLVGEISALDRIYQTLKDEQTRSSQEAVWKCHQGWPEPLVHGIRPWCSGLDWRMWSPTKADNVSLALDAWSFSRLGLRESRVGGPTPQKRRFPHRPSQLDGVKHNWGPDSGHVSERLCFESPGFRSGEKDRDRLFSCSTPSKRRVGVPEVRGESGRSVFGVLVLPSSPRRRSIRGSLLALISGCSSIHLCRDQESDHSCPAKGHGPCPFCSTKHY